MSRNSIPAEASQNVVEDEFIDPDNLEALDAAMQPVTGVFPLTLPNGKKLKIPYKVLGFAYGLEASRGEKFKENEANDPDKHRRIWMKKTNMGLIGWHVVDDIKRKLESPAVLISKRQIPISLFSPREWNLINELIFPGSLDVPETLQNRADALRDDALYEVSATGFADSGGN